MTVEQHTQEIEAICKKLTELADAISQLEPVSHLSKAKIQWTGGVLGAVQEVREGKRLEKLINEPIYNGMSFYQLAFYIATCCETMVDKQLEVQKLVSPDNLAYYENTKLIAFSVNAAHNAWYNYSPDMANEGITIGDEKNVALNPSVLGSIKEDTAKLDLPPELQSYKQPDNPESGGCFGALLVLLLGTASLIGLSYYGISQLMA